MTSDDTLIRMANQIGQFFDSMPDRDEALRGIANHIAKFWEPRMRRRFLERVDSGQAPQLSDIVQAAVRVHRASFEVKTASTETAGH